MKKQRIAVAMSGGVDSALATGLLAQQGYEVFGLTMCFNLADSSRKNPGCCSLQGIEDARRVAHKLGIKHYVLNMQKGLDKYVIDDFCSQYLLGRTPNPCVRCNEHLKFGALLEKALSLDARFLATGHYARIGNSKLKTQNSKLYFLKKAADSKKDQSYFLYRLTQKQLKHILFPVGDYTKDEVRKLAKKLDLPVADKAASQDICFLPKGNYREFIKTRLGFEDIPGEVRDTAGNLLGRHRGISNYTVGQREGLGISGARPLYIIKIDPGQNLITVGGKEEAFKKEFFAGDLTFIAASPKKKVEARVKIRYNHKEALARIEPGADKARVIFKEAQFAITPGQSAVFYLKDRVLGGGIIERVLD